MALLLLSLVCNRQSLLLVNFPLSISTRSISLSCVGVFPPLPTFVNVLLLSPLPLNQVTAV